MEIALNTEIFSPLAINEEMKIDGGINWDRVFGGTTVFLGATLTVCSLSGPIGWGVGISYIAISAAAGAYIGYGLIS